MRIFRSYTYALNNPIGAVFFCCTMSFVKANVHSTEGLTKHINSLLGAMEKLEAQILLFISIYYDESLLKAIRSARSKIRVCNLQ